MFNNKSNLKTERHIINSSSIIGEGTFFKGNIDTAGNIRIEGKIVGGVKSKSKVIIGKSSFIEGNILAHEAEIAGEIRGNLEVANILVLKSASVVNGDIAADELVVEAGAIFNGGCKIKVPSKETSVTAPENVDTIQFPQAKVAS